MWWIQWRLLHITGVEGVETCSSGGHPSQAFLPSHLERSASFFDLSLPSLYGHQFANQQRLFFWNWTIIASFFFLLLHFSVLTQWLLSSDYIFFLCIVFCILSLGVWHQRLPWWLSGNEPACQCRRCPFDPWVRNVPWRRKWQPTPVFLPGESHGQRSLVGCSPWGCKRIRLDLATKQQQQ